MQIETPEKRPRGENIIPMINVVFLLLIFFMISATLSAPDALQVTPPVSDANVAATEPKAILIGADGRIAFGEARGEAALLAAKAAFAAGALDPLPIRADARAEGLVLAQVLQQLQAAGVNSTALLVEPRP